MALVACRECGGKVSTKATACPACGAAVARPMGFFRMLSWGMVATVTLVVAWQCGTAMNAADRGMRESAASRAPSPTPPPAPDRVAQEQAALAQKRLEREKAFLAAGPAKVVAEMNRLNGARRYDAALAYGDPYFDVGDQAFRTAYERASKGVEDETRKKAAALAKKEGVQIGMTKEQVLASSWGKPRSINSSHYAWGTHEQWVYGGGYLYFENGILTAVQN